MYLSITMYLCYHYRIIPLQLLRKNGEDPSMQQEMDNETRVSFVESIKQGTKGTNKEKLQGT
jgi:hypothetical protein